MLLVDGDKNLEQCDVFVNGQKVPAHLLSVNNFDAAHYDLYRQMNEFSPLMGVEVEDFRQWRAVRLDTALINWRGPNRIELAVKAPVATVYGDANLESGYILSPNYFSYGQVANAPTAAATESRLIEPVRTGNARHSSRILSGSRAERLFDSLRMRLACVMPSVEQTPSRKVEAPPPAAHIDGMPFSLSLPVTSFNALLQEGDQVRVNKSVMQAACPTSAFLKLPAAPAGKSHVRLTISGEAKALSNPGQAGISVSLQSKNAPDLVLGKLPRALQASGDWQSFVITDTVPVSLVNNRPDSLSVTLYPVPTAKVPYGVSRNDPDLAVRNIQVHGDFINLPAIAGARVIYY